MQWDRSTLATTRSGGRAREPQGCSQVAKGREASLEQQALSRVTARAGLEGSSRSAWSLHQRFPIRSVQEVVPVAHLREFLL